MRAAPRMIGITTGPQTKFCLMAAAYQTRRDMCILCAGFAGFLQPVAYEGEADDQGRDGETGKER